MCLPVTAKKTSCEFIMCRFQQIQQSTKAMCIPCQQQQVTTTEGVLITSAPIVVAIIPKIGTSQSIETSFCSVHNKNTM